MIIKKKKKNLEDWNKIQGVPDCLENISIRMKPILDTHVG